MRHAHPSIIIIVVLFVYSAISLIKCQTVCWMIQMCTCWMNRECVGLYIRSFPSRSSFFANPHNYHFPRRTKNNNNNNKNRCIVLFTYPFILFFWKCRNPASGKSVLMRWRKKNGIDLHFIFHVCISKTRAEKHRWQIENEPNTSKLSTDF